MMLSLLLTGAGWWWRTRNQANAQAMAVKVVALPTEAPNETETFHKTSRKVQKETIDEDSLLQDKQHRSQRNRHHKRMKQAATPTYIERQPLDEPIDTQ